MIEKTFLTSPLQINKNASTHFAIESHVDGKLFWNRSQMMIDDAKIKRGLTGSAAMSLTLKPTNAAGVKWTKKKNLPSLLIALWWWPRTNFIYIAEVVTVKTVHSQASPNVINSFFVCKSLLCKNSSLILFCDEARISGFRMKFFRRRIVRISMTYDLINEQSSFTANVTFSLKFSVDTKEIWSFFTKLSSSQASRFNKICICIKNNRPNSLKIFSKWSSNS